MELVKAWRRTAFLSRKRLQLLKYTFQHRMNSENLVDQKSDYGQTSEKQRSVNLLDFGIEKDRELYMLDIYSD